MSRPPVTVLHVSVKLLLLALLPLALCPPTYGQECEVDYSERYGVTQPGDCVEHFGGVSRCWSRLACIDGTALKQAVNAGFPLQIGLRDAIVVPDLPPRSLDPLSSSAPFVAREALRGSRRFALTDEQVPGAFAERATFKDLIDIATGSLLYQETDFELPFGSAVFRHIRTNGDPVCQALVGHSGGPDHLGKFGYNPSDWFWDWNGLGWMMSENPLLLIDASYDDVGVESGQVCYFIPDSHHSVPFIRQGEHYVAPSWFDAELVHDASDPFVWRVKLNRGAVCYTFRTTYEDVWQFRLPEDPNQLIDAHDPATYGIPYYAFVHEIRDRDGNRAVFSYCPNRQGDGDDPNSPDCYECYQNCNEKGQLNRVQLFASGASNPTWTVAYVYREFATLPLDGIYDCKAQYQNANPAFSSHMLHAVYVYAGDAALPSECMTLPISRFMGFGSFDAYDQIDAVSILGLPTNWVTEARYLYEEQGSYRYRVHPGNEGVSEGDPYVLAGQDGNQILLARVGTNLIKCTVTSRSALGEILDRRRSLYRYSTSRVGSDTGYSRDHLLRAVFTEDAIANLLAHMPGTPNENALIPLADATVVAFSETIGPLVSFADVRRRNWTYEDGPPQEAEVFATSGAFVELVQDVGADASRSVLQGSGIHEVWNRERGTTRTEVTRFRCYPERDHNGNEIEIDWQVLPGPGIPVEHAQAERPIYHWPFRFLSPVFHSPSDGASFVAPQSGRHGFHWVVVDEFDQSGTPAREDDRLVSRRAVELNMAGFIVRDRTWTYPLQGEPGLEQSGYGEQFIYDDLGRVQERRTVGWDVANQQGMGDSEGVVYTYEYYPEDAEHRPGELRRVGIKCGAGPGAPVYPLAEYEYGHPDRRELVTRETRFSSYSGTVASEILHSFQFGAGDDPPIRMEASLQSAGPLTLGGPDTYAGTISFFDEMGRNTWKGGGSFPGIDGNGWPTAALAFNSTHDTYNDRGELLTHVEDSLESPPEGFPARVAPTPALALTTTYEYYDAFGLKQVVYPDGTERHIVYSDDPQNEEHLIQWIYSDVHGIDEGGQTCLLGSPVQVNVYRGVSVESALSLAIESTVYPPAAGAYPPDPSVIITKAEVDHDESGRIAGIRDESGDGLSSTSMQVGYHHSGQVAWKKDPDGTITRNVFDNLNRLRRVFRGTCDTHPYWRTAETCDPNLPLANWLQCRAENYEDNLVLIEKREYGEGIRDIDLLTRVRSFRDQPLNAYFERGPDGGLPANNEDQLGWVTLYGYDWRMRPVWTEERDGSDAAVRRTATWLDHLDRPRLIASFTPSGPPASIDPRLIEPGDDGPSAYTVLLTSGPALLGLTEYVYDARGMVQEERVYHADRQAPSAADFTATRKFYDVAGRVIETHAPGAPVQTTVYDFKGRQVSTANVVAGFEITRTDSVYGDKDRLVQTVHRERAPGGVGPVLDDSNSIATYQQNWYDDSGRVIATARFGTNSADDTFVTGPDPLAQYDPSSPPLGSTGNALVTLTQFDDAGRVQRSIGPDGLITEYEYDGLGRTILETEWNPADADTIRRTAYRFEDAGGRLIAIASLAPGFTGNPTNWSDIASAVGSVQVTELQYGGAVVDSNGTAISANGGFISGVRFPDPESGQPETAPSLSFTYFSDGQVASRTDARGITMQFRYDEQNRLREASVDDSDWFEALPQDLSEFEPAERIVRIMYDYTPDGRQRAASTYVPEGSGERLLSESTYEYGAKGDLEYERQSHEGQVGVGTPFTQYEWDFSSAAEYNFHRLAAITYPARPSDSSSRQVGLQYGDGAGSPDSLLGRVTSISDSGVGATVATFSYAGLSRRASMQLGAQLKQSFVQSGQLRGLDRHGRVADLHFKRGSKTLHRYQFAYDRSGNQSYARVVQAPVTVTQVNQPPVVYSRDNVRSCRYAYDGLQQLLSADLGRLDASNQYIVNDSAVPLRRMMNWTLDTLGNWTGDQAAPGLLRNDDTDGDGDWESELEVSHVIASDNRILEVVSDGSGGPGSAEFVHDAAGNLTFDSTYWYQYDAWNRLVQVNYAGDLTASDFDASGQVSPLDPNSLPGEAIAAFRYDGLGRLIRKTCPFTQFDGECRTTQTHDYYYDGVRRIQTVIHTPPPEPGLCSLSWSFPDWSECDYVYGPDGVDELVLQVAEDDKPFYAIQDPHGNLMGLVNKNGNVAQQYQYEPYGELVAAEKLAAGLANSIGFQGLFWEPLSILEAPATLTPDAPGLYYVRNRWYSPALGRFLQRDVNETALPIVAALAFNAQTLDALMGTFQLQSLYGGGPNLYGYASADPVNGRDALGLYDDAWLDDFIADYTAWKLYVLATLNEAAGAASVGLQTAVRIASSFLPGAGLYDAFQSVEVLASGRGGFWDVLNIAMETAPIVKGMMSLRSLGGAFRWGARACNCFVAGTLVESAEGELPIEAIQPGDVVVTRPDGCPECPARPGAVTRVFRDIAPAILWISLASGQVFGVTEGHEVWTQQAGWTSACQLSVGGAFIDAAGEPVEIVEIVFDPTPTTVYNLEVDGAFTYFAEGVWVHNDSCTLSRMGRVWNNYGHSFEYAVRQMHYLPVYTGPKLRGGGEQTSFLTSCSMALSAILRVESVCIKPRN